MEVHPLTVPAPEAFAAFTDVAQQRRWVPGLKRVKVVRTDASGRPLEAFYEFGESLAYALVYAWDDAALKARWVPSSGIRDGVSGSVWFEPAAQGCVMHYHLDGLKGRSPTHEREVVQGFVEFLKQR